MTSPPLGASVAMGVRALAGEAWLLPVSASISLLRSLALLPAFAFGIALPLEGAAQGMRLRPFSWTAPFEGALAVGGSLRYLAIVAALGLVGGALSGLLRVLFLSGALPTLATRLARTPGRPVFATGVAWGLPRQLATSLLGTLAELAALGYLVAAAVASLRLAGGELGALRATSAAAFGALALTIGGAGWVAARVIGDAAAARTAILGEGPAAAFAGAVRRFLGRPGAFALGGMAFAAAAAAVGPLLQPATAILAQVGERLDGRIVLGPELMVALLAALGAAAVDLGWLATVSALACAELRSPGTEAGDLSA